MNLIKGINSFIILIIIIECHEMKILYRALLYVAFMPQMKWHCLLVLSVICIFYNYLYSPVSYYNEDRRLPIYSNRKDGFLLSEIGNVLVCKNISKDRICCTQPVNVVSNVSFVVDVQSLDDPNDLKADENGVWERKGSLI